MPTSRTDNENRHRRYLVWFVILAVVIISLVVGYYFIVTAGIEQNAIKSSNNVGTFGDMFGGITALFSGLAFAGIIITVWMQAHELKLMHEEYEKSSAALELTSRLESFRYYLGKYPTRINDKDTQAINKIIKSMTENLLRQEEYVDLMTPRLVVRSTKPNSSSNGVLIDLSK